jgi:hypothetical protein
MCGIGFFLSDPAAAYDLCCVFIPLLKYRNAPQNSKFDAGGCAGLYFLFVKENAWRARVLCCMCVPCACQHFLCMQAQRMQAQRGVCVCVC